MVNSKDTLLNRPDVARVRRAGSGYSYEWRFYAQQGTAERKVDAGADVIFSKE